MNKKGDNIFCHLCNRWCNKYIEVLIIDEKVYCLRCYENFSETMLGYEWEWENEL
jgi:hypothetical protein